MALAGVGAVAALAYFDQANENAQRAERHQKEAEQRVQQNADRAARDADMAFNAAHPKKPDISKLLQANALRGAAGNSSTFLTGAQGADAPTTKLGGKSTLLGL